MLRHFHIRDDAFAVLDNLLAPWPEDMLPVQTDAVNFYLYQLRQTTERVFGVLLAR